MKKVDMSSEAITRRLRQVDQLRELCLSLMKAKKISDEKKAEINKQQNAKSEVKSGGAEFKSDQNGKHIVPDFDLPIENGK